ncbi:MAG TPA: hypothetical protein PLL75_06860 [Candidatus Omnitrophota bacterium]|nr:hypothetical protein [Candidatus Omnitrophota bacterium]HPS37426.1 hypothetical protein [Candidatus Omnitrophota bacterium]
MIEVGKPKISASQVAIFAGSLAVLALALAFQVFVDWKTDERLISLRRKYHLVEEQLKWVGQVIREQKNPDQAAAYFMKIRQELLRRFPAEEAKSLLMLTEYAYKFQIKVDKITTKPAGNFRDSRGEVLRVDGKPAKVQLVTMTVKCEYLNLIRYIEALRKILPAYMAVERLDVVRRSADSPPLSAVLELSLFFLE